MQLGNEFDIINTRGHYDHWLGSNNVMTAADVMYMSYGLSTAPFPLVPIPTRSLTQLNAMSLYIEIQEGAGAGSEEQNWAG